MGRSWGYCSAGKTDSSSALSHLYWLSIDNFLFSYSLDQYENFASKLECNHIIDLLSLVLLLLFLDSNVWFKSCLHGPTYRSMWWGVSGPWAAGGRKYIHSVPLMDQGEEGKMYANLCFL